MMGNAVVVGASGGIGRAVAQALVRRRSFAAVHALSRSDAVPLPGVIPGRIELDDETAIASAFDAIEGDIDLVFVATGLLHDGGQGPERSLRAIDAHWMARNFAVNAIGPALVIKHAVQRLPRDRRSAIAVLSARVGSIADNRTGGWYGYRASKAALNMILRTAAIEVARTRPHAIVAGLHPGTVDTALSKPFQRSVAPDRLFDADRAAAALLAVLDGLTPQNSGRVHAWDGQEIPA